jgi:ADP-ribosyl-[dinitrogen reductase] hydrolase
MTRSRFRGTVLGVVIGDALGKPVEPWSLKKIQETYGRVTEYKPLDGHKWFDGHPVGSTTDDTAFTFAMLEALNGFSGVNMDAIAKSHVARLDTAGGMGPSTKEAIKRLKDGTHWSVSGHTDKEMRGTGNGVAMKVAPIGMYLACNPDYARKDPGFMEEMFSIARMTHDTDLAVASGLSMAGAISYLLSLKDPQKYNEDKMVDVVAHLAAISDYKLPIEDQLAPKLRYARTIKDRPEMIVSELKGGCYINESLPFTFGFFWRDPWSIESLYDVVSAGGDTDSNGSMLGAMLGALNGEAIFPKHLTEGLVDYNEAIELADRFYDTFAPAE